MRRFPITANNRADLDGNPTGGNVSGVGLSITWQDGPRGTGDRTAALEAPNGAFVEWVVEAARQRLEFFQTSKFACRENALAITKLEEALHWLQARAEDRADRGVLGSHEV